MSGPVHWLRELDEETYALMPGRRVLIERAAFESIGDYTQSQPTGPSAGRIYRKNLDWRTDTPDNWWLFICERDLDPLYVLHRSYRVEIVE